MSRFVKSAQVQTRFIIRLQYQEFIGNSRCKFRCGPKRYDSTYLFYADQSSSHSDNSCDSQAENDNITHIQNF